MKAHTVAEDAARLLAEAELGLAARLRSNAARIAALTLHSQTDGAEHTAPARRKFWSKFEDEVDPDRKLSAAERTRRAAIARSLHFARLGRASAKKRQKELLEARAEKAEAAK